MLAIYRNDGINTLRLRKSTHFIGSPPTLGDGDNGNYSTFEFTSNELSEITYLQLCHCCLEKRDALDLS